MLGLGDGGSSDGGEFPRFTAGGALGSLLLVAACTAAQLLPLLPRLPFFSLTFGLLL